MFKLNKHFAFGSFGLREISAVKNAKIPVFTSLESSNSGIYLLSLNLTVISHNCVEICALQQARNVEGFYPGADLGFFLRRSKFS